jgi:FtsH-binding integral membrane protein
MVFYIPSTKKYEIIVKAMEPSSSASCNPKAMGLVALQLALLFGSVCAAKAHPSYMERLSSWPGVLASFLLMVAGIWGVTSRRCEIASWLCFTMGVLIIGLQLGRYDNQALKRGIIQASFLLFITAIIAPFVGYYEGLGGALLLLTMALLIAVVSSMIWPSKKLDVILSAAGGALFAVWTVHDVAARPCESPWLKSVEVFLDIFNLLAFSVQ